MKNHYRSKMSRITWPGRVVFLHGSFLGTLVVKGLFSVFEMFGGGLLLFVAPEKINHLVILLTQNELSEDPNDILVSHLVLWSQHLLGSSRIFIAVYLLSHGMVKLFIIASLWIGKLWAYPAGMALFLIFIAYQVYRYEHSHSMWLIFLTVLDVVLIYLTWVEYQHVKTRSS